MIFLLFILHLFLLKGFSFLGFSLPGDNSARTSALFLFFALCGLNTYLIVKSVTTKFFMGFLSITCASIAISLSSRSAIVVFLLILLFFILFQSILNKDSVRRWTLVYFFCAIVLFSCLFWFLVMHKNAKEKISSVLQLPEQIIAYVLFNEQESYRTIARLVIWNNAINRFKENPLFGVGYGSEYHNEILKIDHSHPHSIIFQLLAETGLIGFGIFSFFTFFVFKKSIADYKSIQSTEYKSTYLFYPLSFTFFLLFSCFHFAIHENYFFWYFAGMIVGFDTSLNGRGSPRKATEFH